MAALKLRFHALPPAQRLLAVGLLGAALLAVAFVFVLHGRVDYGVLFANLSQEDAAAIVAKLKTKKIPYRLEAGGSSILVPQSQVYETRLLLASEGMPRGGGVGFEIFDRQNLGVTDFVQRLNYQRALQGELARTLAGIPEIAEARVHIVVPKESLFIEEQQQASASIALKLRPGRTLSRSQVDGIVHLVASAVPGLHPSQVTVVDLSGRILSRPQDDLGLGLTTGQLALQRQVEESYERKVQSLFDNLLGPRKSIVRVTADLDFQKIDIREETFIPNRELVRSEQKTLERTTRAREGWGNPEARFNLGQGTITPPPGKGPPPLLPPAQAKPSPGSTAERQSELRNYEINRVVRQIVDSPGKIKRLSIAIVVDGVYQNQSKTFAPRSPEEMRRLANLAKKAVGFNAERGDQLEISCAPLASQPLAGAVAASVGDSWWKISISLLKIVLLGLVVLGALIFLLRQKPFRDRPSLLKGPPASVLSPQPEAERTLAAETPTPKGLPGEKPRVALPDAVGGQERVAQLVTAYPDRAVEVLRLWLHEKDIK
ncbi:MAG: flagellar M-ring protein FliF [Deltaproteobacteria bacterium]|nr:flagellar M-ring protein FliF [Deltaproteobacteria bacterium]